MWGFMEDQNPPGDQGVRVYRWQYSLLQYFRCYCSGTCIGISRIRHPVL